MEKKLPRGQSHLHSLVKGGGVYPPIFGEYEHILNTLPRRIRLDAIAVIRLFKGRRRGKLTDSLLCRVWECSRGTCQRRLSVLEQSGLLKRLTAKPKRVSGVWKQLRIICLLKPKPCVSKADTINPNGQDTANEKFSLEKQALMLSRRINISRRWWCFLLRQMGAQRISGFPMKLYEQVKDRTDIIEGDLWTMVETSPPPYRPAGFFLAEIKARAYA